MKHLKWALAGLVLAIVPVFAWVSIAGAQKFSNSIEKGRTVDSSLYSAGKTVDINGTINGDVFCAGQTVTIDATVHGDVICAGQDVTISGKVDGNVRVAGQTVAIEAQIGRSATVAAMSFSLDAPARVGQDLTATGDTLNIKGQVGRDVLASGSSVTLNGKVGRNVKADGNKIRLKEDALIAGNLNYTSNKDAELASGAEVNGKTIKLSPAKDDNNSVFAFNAGVYIFVLFGMLFLGLALAYFFPQFLQRTTDVLKASFLKATFVGLGASFVLPMLSVGLIIMVIGIPFTFVIFAAWLFAALLTAPISAYFAGRLIFRKRPTHPVLIMLLGSVVLATAYFFPLAGVLFIMLSYWAGFGALLLTLNSHVKAGATPATTEPTKAATPKSKKKKNS